MSRQINYLRTLVYYDTHQLFLAEDKVGTRFVCLLVDNQPDFEAFLCTPISPTKLSKFTRGKLDLRDIFEFSETSDIYFAKSDGEITELIVDVINRKDILDNWLPDPGFFLEQGTEDDSIISLQSLEKNRAIIHLSVDPPESREGFKIKADHLVNILSIFQKMLKYSYKKSISELNEKRRRELDEKMNYQLEVFSFAPTGSFTLHLQSEVAADMFGQVEIERALEQISKLMNLPKDKTKWIDTLQIYRGHFLSSFKQLLGYIVDNDSPIHCRWLVPARPKSLSFSVTTNLASDIYHLLTEQQELTREIVEMIGVVVQANVKTGTWIMQPESNKGQKYRGTLPSNSDISLNGITLGNRLYKFKCEERQEEVVGTGEPKRTLLLMDFESISDV